ncbi:MAG: AMP-binding protein [Rothia sp.]|uniref:AMP-binding protein n=1 Tax=Rothia sp. (in: high G+C Gram-positive bacteria) TaxID=1885016 RepID=UPI001CB3D723|nr:AMP-binding protein [Rothia sp. (in: high G+C Gram-positive bacteria)]MBF1680654.1 AMP-binding protein [Rothia sp. (in: high G+C Gram-positive bacteria)]
MSEMHDSANNIAYLLAEAASSSGAKAALAIPSSEPADMQVMSYAQLASAASQVQRHLEALGVERGDRVALSMPNVALMPALYYGIVATGAICVPLNPLLSGAELEYHLRDSGAKVLFAFAGTRLASEASSTVLVKNGSVRCEIFTGGEGSPVAPFDAPTETVLEPVPVVASDPAIILYTSGTTGKPKGATLTHANILSNARSCVSVFGFTAEDVIFGGLPLFHAFGQTVSMNAAFAASATVALLPRFTPDGALNLIERAGVSVLAAVPSMYVSLAAALEAEPERARSLRGRIRFGISGGSPLPAPVHAALKTLIECPVYEGYGLSETSPVVSFNQAEFGMVLGSVGRVLPGVQVQVRCAEGSECAPGVSGQLWVRGENVMAGYWNNPAATAEVFDGEWFATGDVARVDEQGNIFIVDRIKDMVLRNGYSVYPREIEDVLYTHEQVQSVAVLGVLDERVGEEVVAVVMPRPGADEGVLQAELNALARTRLAAYKYPRRYVMVESMPLGPTGKILKRDLRVSIQRG